MKRIKNSLLAQFLFIILAALLFLPITFPLLSIVYFNVVESVEEQDRLYNGVDLEQMWHQTAKQLHNSSEDAIRSKLEEIKQAYPESSVYWVDGEGTTRLKLPVDLNIPSTWSSAFTVDFMKNNRGLDVNPFTSVALLDRDMKEGFIVFQLPRNDMVSPTNLLHERLSYLLPISIIIVFFAFIFVSMLFFSRIRKRLLHLQKVMTNTEENGFPSVIEVKKEDEIGRLEMSFNDMVNELNEGRVRELEEEALRKELIANLSHDLRTPLTTIRGHAFRLQKEALSEKGQESIALIDAKVDHMSELIDNLLSYTLLTSGKYPCHAERVDVVRIVRTVFAGWYPTFEKLQFEIHTELPEDALYWTVDAQWLHRIIDNVLQNVYRHAKSGKFISVRLEQNTIFIEDRGPGMEATSSEEGTGIGLSIISLMAKEMQVTWDLQTNQYGTTVTLTKNE